MVSGLCPLYLKTARDMGAQAQQFPTNVVIIAAAFHEAEFHKGFEDSECGDRFRRTAL